MGILSLKPRETLVLCLPNFLDTLKPVCLSASHPVPRVNAQMQDSGLHAYAERFGSKDVGPK